LAEFKTSDLQVLVATDIAARGIDIDQLPHVVNYDLPNVPEDYVHRIGRTGRAGATGEAVSLVCVDEHAFLKDIEKLIKRQIPRVVVAGFEPDPNAKAEPILMGRGQGQRQGQGRGQGHGQGRGGQSAGRGASQGNGQNNGQRRGGQGSGQGSGRGNGQGSGQGNGEKRQPAQAQPARQGTGRAGPAKAPAGPRPAAGTKPPALLHRTGGRGR
jgi:ATP-dependent RNA helicase RhlE